MQPSVKEKLSIQEVESLLKVKSPRDFSNKDLSKLDLRNKEMISADLSNAQMSEVNFQYSNLGEALLVNSNLNEANLNNSTLTRANFSNASMLGANLNYISTAYPSHKNGPIFSNADLSGSNLNFARIPCANFSSSNLNCAILNHAVLTHANLTNANLTDAKLINANLTGAKLINANLKDADLSLACLKDSDLTNADFTNANIVNVSFDNATLTEAKFNGVIRKSFNSNYDQIKSAPRFFRNLLKNRNLTIDQKKQMLEIDDENPDKTKLSEYLKEKKIIIFEGIHTGSEEKTEFQSFLNEVIELEAELAPKIEQQPLIKQEPFADVNSNKRRREEKSPASVNGEGGSGQRASESNPSRDPEALDAAQILVLMKKR
jgi:uncharacterized protein YjbI with pentapeptide repeats